MRHATGKHRTTRLVMFYKIHNGLVAILCRCFWNYTPYLPEQRTRRPITFRHPYETTTCTRSIHAQWAIGIFFLRLSLWQLLLKLLRIQFLNRSYPGTTPFRCRESHPYHEEPRLKISFTHFFLHLQLCFCTVHQRSHWPRYRLWVFNILKLSCTLEEEEVLRLSFGVSCSITLYGQLADNQVADRPTRWQFNSPITNSPKLIYGRFSTCQNVVESMKVALPAGWTDLVWNAKAV